jgi:hypothetical protein
MSRSKKKELSPLLTAMLVGVSAFARYLHENVDEVEVDLGLQKLCWYAFCQAGGAHMPTGNYKDEKAARQVLDTEWEELTPDMRNLWRDFTRYMMIGLKHPDWGTGHKYGQFLHNWCWPK